MQDWTRIRQKHRSVSQSASQSSSWCRMYLPRKRLINMLWAGNVMSINSLRTLTSSGHKYFSIQSGKRDIEGDMGSKGPQFQNAKQTLMQIADREKKDRPIYKLIQSSGPAHEPSFRFEIKFDGHSIQGEEQSNKATGMESAAETYLREVLHRNIPSSMDSGQSPGHINNRSLLNELGQKKRMIVEYDHLEEYGKGHEKKYCIRARIGNFASDGQWETSIQQAQESAATNLLKVLQRENFIGEQSREKQSTSGGRGKKVEMATKGVLILIDLDNWPQSVNILHDYLTRNVLHGICSIECYASKIYDPALHRLPDYMTLCRAKSFDRDAADILMVFEAALKLNDLVNKEIYTSVLLCSKDHFVIRLKEIIQSYGVDCECVAMKRDMVDFLQKHRI